MGRNKVARFKYYILNEGVKESIKEVPKVYFEFAVMLFLLMGYPHAVAVSNEQRQQYLVYGEHVDDFA